MRAPDAFSDFIVDYRKGVAFPLCFMTDAMPVIMFFDLNDLGVGDFDDTKAGVFWLSAA